MKKNMFQLFIISLLLIGLFTIGCSSSSSEKTTSGATVELEDGKFKIPLEEITNKVQKFEYNAQGTLVKFFAVRGSNGKVRTAFDACDVCGGNKGYEQKGKDIVCKNCGKVFSIDGLGTQNKGYGCWPSYLTHSIEEGNILINTAELEQGAFRFA